MGKILEFFGKKSVTLVKGYFLAIVIIAALGIVAAFIGFYGQNEFEWSQTKRWAEGIRVPAPLAGRGSTTARGILRLCPASACQTGLPWSSPPA